MEQLGVQYYMTGSEALARYGEPVEQAEFLLRRLYPEESESWFLGVIDRLRAARAAGTWNGFQRAPAA